MITLEEVKKAKDLEIEKYKKYLNKAKKIIENIGDKSQASEDGLEVCIIIGPWLARRGHLCHVTCPNRCRV